MRSPASAARASRSAENDTPGHSPAVSCRAIRAAGRCVGASMESPLPQRDDECHGAGRRRGSLTSACRHGDKPRAMRAMLRRFPSLRPAARRPLRGACVAALTLVLTEALGGAATAAPCDRCNVVLVTFDALRADRLGVYGSRKPTSPVLDAFARRSAVFEDCISQSATTVSAVPAILTGRYPVTDSLLEGLTLRADVDTTASVLRRAGYRTLAVIGHTFAGCKYSRCRDVDAISDATPT